MKNLDRGKNSVPPQLGSLVSQSNRLAELESYRQQADQYWQQSVQAEEEAERYKQEAAKSAVTAQKHKKNNQNLIQRLLDAITSRNSMRGRLGNMTAQRNRSLRQVENLTAQNKEVMLQLKTTTDKLGEVYQQVGKLETEYEQDMTELATAYQDMSSEQRNHLPLKLRQLLEQVEQDYKGAEP